MMINVRRISLRDFFMCRNTLKYIYFLFYEVLYKREPQVLQRSFTTVQECIFRAVPSKTHNK